MIFVALLRALALAIQVRRAIEIGTAIGYSSTWSREHFAATAC
jgi:predicted O-methyltransferase YrrM